MGDLQGADDSSQCCSFKKKTEFDRKMHIPGSCVIHIGSTYQTCPQLRKFSDVKIRAQAGLSLAAWTRKLRRPFYQDYLQKGGEEGFKSWLRSRWSQ